MKKQERYFNKKKKKIKFYNWLQYQKEVSKNKSFKHSITLILFVANINAYNLTYNIIIKIFKWKQIPILKKTQSNNISHNYLNSTILKKKEL